LSLNVFWRSRTRSKGTGLTRRILSRGVANRTSYTSPREFCRAAHPRPKLLAGTNPCEFAPLPLLLFGRNGFFALDQWRRGDGMQARERQKTVPLGVYQRSARRGRNWWGVRTGISARSIQFPLRSRLLRQRLTRVGPTHHGRCDRRAQHTARLHTATCRRGPADLPTPARSSKISAYCDFTSGPRWEGPARPGDYEALTEGAPDPPEPK